MVPVGHAGPVKRVAVLGQPIAHSLSPAMHRAGYAAAGLAEWTYEAIECDAESLPGLVSGLGPEWAGFSVTMPGKAAAAAFASVRSERVRRLGVANTLYRNSSDAGGGWAAENTDVDGVIDALVAHGVADIRRVLILGGGHTARAVVAALAETGARTVVLAGRRPSSTAGCAALGRELGLELAEIDLSAEQLAGALIGVDLLVSTIPVTAAAPLAEVLAPAPVLLDVVYHPWPTALAAARGSNITVTGLDMLLHQGLRQFEIFTGLPAPAAAMRDGLLAAAGATIPLPLTGR